MKQLLSIALFLSSPAFCECTNSWGPSDAPEKDETLFGGCEYFTFTFRGGYSNEFDGYLSAGVIVPFDQSYSGEGYYSDTGIVFSASKYSDTNIYDVGLVNRHTYTVVSTGWEAGFSYGTNMGHNYRVYFAYHLIGEARLRAMRINSDTELSLEFGFKF